MCQSAASLPAPALGNAAGMVAPAADRLRSLSSEPPTPTPYQWPAHHAVYVHTGGAPTQCRVDDGVTEPFVVSIPGTTWVTLGGRELTAGPRDAVIASCTAPTTIVLDPDVRYNLADSDGVRVLVELFAYLGFWSTLADILVQRALRGLRRAPAAPTPTAPIETGSDSSRRRVTLRRVGNRLVLRRW